METSKSIFTNSENSIKLDNSNLMDSAISTLLSVNENLKGVLKDLTRPPAQCEIDPDLNRLDRGIKSLATNIEHISSSINTKDKEMASTIEELEAVRTKYKNLQREWDNQQEHLGRLQGEMFKMRAQLKHQSTFCASLGAVMGSLLWKSTRLPDVNEILLSSKRLDEFICIVSGSLESFLETYSSELPNINTDELQFVLGLVGVVANLASQPGGRSFLATDTNGTQLIHQLVDILPIVPVGVSGDCLKRVIMMALYNLSISQPGLIELLKNSKLITEVAKSIQSERNTELSLLSLRLLQAITMQIPSVRTYQDIVDVIPLDQVEELTHTQDADMRLIAKSIVKAMNQAGKRYNGDSTSVNETTGWNKCRRLPGNKSECSVSSNL